MEVHALQDAEPIVDTDVELVVVHPHVPMGVIKEAALVAVAV